MINVPEKIYLQLDEHEPTNYKLCLWEVVR